MPRRPTRPTTIPEPDRTRQGPTWRGRPLPRPEEEVVDQGAGFDVATLLTRRRILSALGIGAGGLALAACGSDGTSSSRTSTASTSGTATTAASPSTSTTAGTTADTTADTGTGTVAAATEEIPQETNGPYPADGTNGVNVLEESGLTRSDITSSLDGGTTVDGTPLTFTFALTDLGAGGTPYEGAAVYVWHCDAQGRYSMYSEGVEDETFLRGVQVADSTGQVTFTTIVPGCYAGRWPHIHFEVYPDAASATSADNAIATSQVAIPQDVADVVYTGEAYDGSATNLARVSLDTDNVFSDGYTLELPTMSGSAGAGYTGTLAVGIDAR